MGWMSSLGGVEGQLDLSRMEPVEVGVSMEERWFWDMIRDEQDFDK